MMLNLDPQLVTLFGSETRVSVLAALAGASRPYTGYRVARVAGVQPIKAYAELRKLRDAGIVRETGGTAGRSGWELPEGDVRSFVGLRTRVSWSEDMLSAPQRTIGPQDLAFLRRVRARAEKRPRPKSVPPAAKAVLKEMKRRVRKDQNLARMGLRTSVRKARGG
jgi:DNA-binding transcriptional ArsR family regulator